MDLEFIIAYSFLGFLVIFTLLLAILGKKYYVFYDHRLLFILGLVFSRSLTESAIIDILVVYFTDHDSNLVASAVLSNIHDSLSSLLVIFMAHAADSFVGRFQTLLFSTTAYIAGLGLMWVFNPYDVKWLVVVALVLLALGTSGSVLLKDVFIGLVRSIDMSPDATKERSLERTKIWWGIARASGYIFAALWVSPYAVGGPHPSWVNTFMICTITITAALIIFCPGHNLYHQEKLTRRPLEIFFRVCYVKLQNSNFRCLVNAAQERSPKNLEAERQDSEGGVQERSLLHLDTERQENGGCNDYTKEVVVVKSLLRIFPMWGTFFVVSVISATGSTFFIEQYSNLNTNKVPIQIYSLIQDFSGFAIPFLFCWICRFRRNEKVKIGVGMLCSIICCAFAWQLEVHRLKGVKNLVDPDGNTTVSFLWLVPQFCVLGFMEGLTNEGLLKFFKSQIDEPMKSYGEQYIELVLGLGKLLNIILILIFKRWLGWFNDTINESRLDKYYKLLVIVCSVNFIVYCGIATCFYKDAERDQDLSDDRLSDGEGL